MYKTEMCRNYIEYGVCKYNERCQFAHSAHELQKVERHPKYKTEICRNFLDNNFCKYGKRCCFLHIEDYEESVSDSSIFKGFYSKRAIETGLDFQGIWQEEKVGIHNYKSRSPLWVASHDRDLGARLISKTINREKIGKNLEGNHALVWTSSPVVYIEKRHKKYYECSQQNMAPGEPVLPSCE